MSKINKFLLPSFLVFISLLVSTDAMAQTNSLSLDSVFGNFTSSSQALTRLVEASSKVMGVFFVISSIFKFAQLGSNPQMSPKVPLTMFFVGIGLFVLPNSLSVVQETMSMGSGGPGSILVPQGATLGKLTQTGITGVLFFIRLIGYIAFVRGWLLLNQAGQGKEGTLGRGLTHIFGGVAAINSQITAQIIANSIGFNLPF